MSNVQRNTAMAVGVASFLFLALLAGIKFANVTGPQPVGQSLVAATVAASPDEVAGPAVGGSRLPETPAAPADVQQAIVDRLIASERHLQAALDSLNRATGNNKGGYDIKGRADLAQAIADISEAIDYARNHAEIAALPAPEARLDISAQVQVSRSHPNAAPNLGRALDSLSAALEELHKTPGGNMGGFRDKVLADIQVAASDTAMGITIASGGGRGPQPNAIRRGPNMNTPNMNLTGRGLPGGGG